MLHLIIIRLAIVGKRNTSIAYLYLSNLLVLDQVEQPKQKF